MQLPNFILLIIGIYWYQYQYTVFFTGTQTYLKITEASSVLKIIEVTSSLHNLSFLDPDPNGVVLDPGSGSK